MEARILPRSEWHRLDEQGDLPPLSWKFFPRDVDVVIVEDEGKIVARMFVMRLTHLEGVWIDPKYKHVTGTLLKETALCTGKWGDSWVIGGAQDDRMRDILGRLGGIPIPAEFYALGG